ncbi:hypothetical protein Q5752_003689 [Cryptotrichosporon argae]
MDTDFHSLSKGVFVIPYRPPAAGPSCRPLADVYDATYARYAAAAQAHEDARTAEQLDEVADWLDRCAASRLLKNVLGVHRVPVAIVQGISPSLPPLLPTVLAHTFTLRASAAPDLAAATRAIAVGFVGEAALAAKKTGRTGIDEVERWHDRLKDRPPLLLHIQQAQLMPPALLAELTYILALHPAIPIRLLLSVPSTAIFLSTWQHIEPTSIDLSVLGSGRTRKRANAVAAVLKTATEASKTALSISDELAEELRAEDELLGGGAPAALKALKWALLHHSHTSPLAALEDNEDSAAKLQTIVDAANADPLNAAAHELLVVPPSKDLASTQNPAPRISILHALAYPVDFIARVDTLEPDAGADGPAADIEHPAISARPYGMDVDQNSAANGDSHLMANGAQRSHGEFKELETLYAMWKSAGRSVNLWDWLEGFRQAMTPDEPGALPAGETDEASGTESGEAKVDADGGASRKRKRGLNGDEDPEVGDDSPEGAGENKNDERERDEEEEARLHAVFVRFVEEARMVGLVRARGKGAGRRGDEVVKGVGLV